MSEKCVSKRIGEALDKLDKIEGKIEEVRNCLSVLERAVEIIIKLYSGVKEVSINLLTEKEMEKEKEIEKLKEKFRDTFEFLDNNYLRFAEQCCSLMTLNIGWMLTEIEDELREIRDSLFVESESEERKSERVDELT